jgi:microcystin-dependent protein
MDIGASNWSETDASNSQPSPDGAPEGMFPSGVNDTIRAVMGAVKRWFNWSSPKITGGSATAYTLTYGVAPGALVDGMTYLVQFHAVNGAGATLNVNGLGAKPLYAYSAGAWYQVPPAFFDVATVCRVIYDAGAGAYRLLMPGAVPTGTVTPFAGSLAPSGYLLAFGQAISRTDYPGLFAVISTTYGAGNGSTTFNVPDLRGRAAFGKGDMGGSESGRLNSQVSSALGSVGGFQQESVSISGSASVSVSVSVSGSLSGTAAGYLGGSQWDADGQRSGGTMAGPDDTYSVSVGGTLGGGGSGSGSISGSTATASNVPPAIVLNQIIRL